MTKPRNILPYDRIFLLLAILFPACLTAQADSLVTVNLNELEPIIN